MSLPILLQDTVTVRDEILRMMRQFGRQANPTHAWTLRFGPVMPSDVMAQLVVMENHP